MSYKDSSKNIFTFSGHVQTLTLNQFVQLIEKAKISHDRLTAGFYQYDKYLSPMEQFHLPHIYSRLNPVTLELKDMVSLRDLTWGVEVVDVPKDDLWSMVHDIATESAKNAGYPTSLVRLEPRLWMCANPANFKVYFNKNGFAVANIYPRKSICWRVTK